MPSHTGVRSKSSVSRSTTMSPMAAIGLCGRSIRQLGYYPSLLGEHIESSESE